MLENYRHFKMKNRSQGKIRIIVIRSLVFTNIVSMQIQQLKLLYLTSVRKQNSIRTTTNHNFQVAKEYFGNCDLTGIVYF